ncbi:MAG: PAS domain S-box protein, partial [Deltaproteobacteria bacterium]|jgi:PAS domain S-box-containing protein|nr:PAS domain S-box protein [Deltaproteobacteria bacterium]
MTHHRPKKKSTRSSKHKTRKPSAAPAGKGINTRVEKERYRVLIEDVADGFYEVDLKGNFLFFNDALCRIFGYSRRKIKNSNFRNFMDEMNAKIALEAFNRIYRTGKGVVDISWEIIRKDGERRYLEISANLIKDNDGEPVGFRGIARDVTDKVMAQSALSESEACALELSQQSRRAEQRYRAFLSFLPIPVFVFNLDNTVSYLNPAFENVFGWSFENWRGKKIPFVPEDFKNQTIEGIRRLHNDKVLRGFETKRLTKDGRLLDIIVDGAIFYDEQNQPAGQVVTLRDVTEEKRNARLNRALFRIARAMYQYRGLDQRLMLITKEIQDLLGVEGAMVILLDEANQEFFFREAVFDKTETGTNFKEIRYPVDKGIAGLVYRTGKPQIIKDAYKNPHFAREIDRRANYRTRNMLDVPLMLEDRMIGVLCAVNKKVGNFHQTHVDVLTTIANLVALPIENASINEELKRSYENVKSLNRTKDRVIHHLSHELKTPISILSASLNLLRKRLSDTADQGWEPIFDRAQRNLQRLLEMQYQLEDILREKNYKAYYMLSTLLDACVDELETLVSLGFGEKDIIQKIRRHVEETYGPRRAKSEVIELGPFVKNKIKALRPKFSHRKCRLRTHTAETSPVSLPPDVLGKIVEGLVRNAVENTPDGGMISVKVRKGERGPEFEVKDNGIGISQENLRLIFENYFTAYDTMQYSTRQPYDFKAGGKGFDLLRMKIFSERYNFNIKMTSQPCELVDAKGHECPGNVAECVPLADAKDCHNRGGTTVTVQFHHAERFSKGRSSAKRKK